MKEGAMEIVFWVIVTIIALAVVDLCALGVPAGEFGQVILT